MRKSKRLPPMKTLLFAISILFSSLFFAQGEEEIKTIWSRNDTSFVVTNESLFRTLDGGVTWTVIPLDDFKVGLKIREIEVVGSSVYVISLAGTHWVFEGPNRGNSWNAISDGIKNFGGNYIMCNFKVSLGQGLSLNCFL